MTTYNSVAEHPLFAQVVPYLIIEKVKPDGDVRPRRRIELRGMPEDLTRRAIRATVKCAHCGLPIFPFRPRTKGDGERVEIPRHVYVAVACPLDVSIGCSRGKAAKQAYIDIEYEYERLRRAARGFPPPPVRGRRS
jgi:hypothetical protein